MAWELCKIFLSFFSYFVRQKVTINKNISFTNYAHAIRFRIGLIGRKLKRWQWHHNFTTWRHRQFFWRCFVSLVKFSYWSKFYIFIITGSGIMTIFFQEGLTRNPEIGNTLVWVLPNIWRLWWITKGIANLAQTSLIKCYWMLQNASVIWLRMGKFDNLSNSSSSQVILDIFGLPTEIFVSINNPLRM